MLTLGLQKRSCYRHEDEWRAVIYQDFRPEVWGVQIPADLEQMISAVYVAPRAEEFFVEVMSSVMDKFDLRKPLVQSALLAPPLRKQDSEILPVPKNTLV